MAPRRLDPSDLAAVLPPGGLTYVQGCSAESPVLAAAVMTAAERLGAMTFTGIFVPGVNRFTYLANERCGVRTFFVTPELRAAGDRVEFLPLCYADILSCLREATIDAALFSVSPPDQDGMCSFGPTVDFLPELWPRIPVRVAQVNPLLPRTGGYGGIPFEALTAHVMAATPLPGTVEDAADARTEAIAAQVARLVPDGATVQAGLGRIPGETLRALRHRRDVRIHSGLIGDAVLDLVESGAVRGEGAVVAGVAIGSRRLYDALGDPVFRFRPVSYTHDAATIAAIPEFFAVNSVLEVDLFGQGYAELSQRGLMSGPGGASDFARGARQGNGMRILALFATAKNRSRIVLPESASGLVSLGRFDTDLVVTEYGSADLRGATHDERAARLIAIAAPQHRDALRTGWSRLASGF